MKNLKEFLAYLKRVPRDFIVLINVRAEDYLKTNIAVLKTIVNDEGLPGVYITVNKPYRTMERVLQENGIKTDKIYFIDCITKTAGGDTKDGGKHVFYLDSAQNLTGLGLAMSEMIQSIPSKDKFLFLDSLSTLLLYHNYGTVAKFSHFLTARMRNWGLRGIFVSIERETDPKLIDQLAQFCDVVVDLNKGGKRDG